MRRLAISVRNDRRSAIDRARCRDDGEPPRAVPPTGRRASADVLRRLALEQPADEPVAVAVDGELAGGDHPRQRRAHRAAGDAEEPADGDDRAHRERRRIEAEEDRQHERAGVERTQPVGGHAGAA